jgi:hypothetical protein
MPRLSIPLDVVATLLFPWLFVKKRKQGFSLFKSRPSGSYAPARAFGQGLTGWPAYFSFLFLSNFGIWVLSPISQGGRQHFGLGALDSALADFPGDLPLDHTPEH